MSTAPKVNNAGRYLCMASEGFAPSPYICPAGVLTQGFGHTKAAGPPPLTGEWTLPFAHALFKVTFEKYAARTRKDLGEETFLKLNDNQFSALTSFVYNVGSLYLKNEKPSGLLRAVRDARYQDVPAELNKWNQAAGKVMRGLVRRRQAEGLLFEGKPEEAVKLAGSIPLVNDRGWIIGTVKPPTGTTPIRLNPTKTAMKAIEREGRDFETPAPTATQPEAPPERHREISKESKQALVSTALTGAAAVVVSTTHDWKTALAVAAFSAAAAALVYFIYKRLHDKEDTFYVD